VIVSISPVFISYSNSGFDYAVYYTSCGLISGLLLQLVFSLAGHATTPPVFHFLDNFCSCTVTCLPKCWACLFVSPCVLSLQEAYSVHKMVFSFREN